MDVLLLVQCTEAQNRPLLWIFFSIKVFGIFEAWLSSTILRAEILSSDFVIYQDRDFLHILILKSLSQLTWKLSIFVLYVLFFLPPLVLLFVQGTFHHFRCMLLSVVTFVGQHIWFLAFFLRPTQSGFSQNFTQLVDIPTLSRSNTQDIIFHLLHAVVIMDMAISMLPIFAQFRPNYH